MRTEDGEEEIMRETNQKNGLKGRYKCGAGKLRLPSASVSFRGQRVAVVSLISDFISQAVLVIFLDGRREEENYEEN